MAERRQAAEDVGGEVDGVLEPLDCVVDGKRGSFDGACGEPNGEVRVVEEVAENVRDLVLDRITARGIEEEMDRLALAQLGEQRSAEDIADPMGQALDAAAEQ